LALARQAPRPPTSLFDDELETITSDYIWGTQTGEESERLQFASQLDQIIAEAKRRGKPEIIDRARVSLVPWRHKKAGWNGPLSMAGPDSSGMCGNRAVGRIRGEGARQAGCQGSRAARWTFTNWNAFDG